MSATPDIQTKQIVEVNWADRWQIYRRLQELQIPCQCLTDHPLQVQLDDAISAIQLWSVVKQLTAPRSELISWLNCCWRVKIDREK